MGSSFDVAMGRVIRELRKSVGLSQEAVGKQVNVTFQQIQKYERGLNRLAACYLPQLAEIFGVTVGEIYERVGSSSTEEPSEAQNDSFLAARYVARIADPVLRKNIVDFTRKCAYCGGEPA